MERESVPYLEMAAVAVGDSNIGSVFVLFRVSAD